MANSIFQQPKTEKGLQNGTGNGVNGHSQLKNRDKILKNPTLIRVLPQEITNPRELEGVSQKVFLDRYALKDEEGKPLEKYPEQMWRRVAKAVAQVESPDKADEWEEKFYNAMDDFKFVPGGRVLSGAGTGYYVTYYNCYVLPCPQDSRDGILDNLKEMVEIMSRGGGVGINLSSLRPRGARVKKVNGFSSGPMNWAELYSVATHDIIQQGGSRRGALMLMLWDWHPDIEEFITVKKDLTRIRGANLSVCVSDRFMEAVENDEDWELKFPDNEDPDYDNQWDGVLEHWVEKGKVVKIYKTVKARKLWDMICEAAWVSAEPGCVFMERYNKMHNNWYFNTINCVNPCVTSDTQVLTSTGWRTIEELYKEGKPFKAVVDGKEYLSTPPFKTGTKKVYRLTTKEGYELRLTADHKVYTERGKVEAGKLKKGEKILLGRGTGFGSQGNLEEGKILGWLVGDGSVKKDVATLFFYGEEKQELAPQFAGMVNTIVAEEGLTTRTYPIAAQYIDKENKAVVESTRLWRIANHLGLKHGDKHLVPQAVFEGTEEIQRGFLQGLFSADGHVAGTPEKGVSVRLTSISEKLLIDTQKLLLNFGIKSTIYKNRRKEQERMLPDGKGSSKLYLTKAYHDLVISKDSLERFGALIGFLQKNKQEKLVKSLALYTRGPYKTSFMATFERLKEDGFEDVFDITVAEVHKFNANGLIISNCGEEGLPSYGVCNLASLNLAQFVNEEGEMDYEALAEHAKIGVRFQDNVIDGDIYILPGIIETQLNGERRIGLGTMGLGDALIKMKLRYGSEEATPVIEKIYRTIRDAAFKASADIAVEKGAFPKFDADKYLQGGFAQTLPEDIREKVREQGIRNSVLLMQAPTGSTSLMCNVTSGIEPVYEFAFTRRDRIGTHKIYHPLYKAWKDAHPGEQAPDYFVSANSLTPEEHVVVQAAVQKYVDASISKTVNAPNTHTVEDVKNLYNLAYKLGCKGVTYMRDGSREGVLSREEEPEKQQISTPALDPSQVLIARPDKVTGATYRVVTPQGNAFITINDDDHGNPIEIFINIGKAGSDLTAMATALGRVISTTLRINAAASTKMRAEQVAEQIAGIGGRRSVGFGADKVHSLPDAVARIIRLHLAEKGTGSGGQAEKSNNTNGTTKSPTPNLQAEAVMVAHNPDPTLASAGVNSTHTSSNGVNHQAKAFFTESNHTAAPLDVTKELSKRGADICPVCGEAALVHEEGCAKCYACGHAEC